MTRTLSHLHTPKGRKTAETLEWAGDAQTIPFQHMRRVPGLEDSGTKVANIMTQTQQVEIEKTTQQ